MPTTSTRARRRLALAAALLAAATTASSPGAAASTVPSTVEATDAPGATLVVEPAVVRAEDGAATVAVTLGTAAPADLVVELALARADAEQDGTIVPGDGPVDATVTAGARLRPGERLLATVRDVDEVTLLTATGAPAEGASADATVTVTGVVLPGTEGPPPTATLHSSDGTLTATVRSEVPALVTVRLRGGETTTFPDRLVLPGQPLELAVPSPAWFAPAEVALTDDRGRTVSVTTGSGPLTALASALLLATVAAAWFGLRRRRH